MRYLLPALLLLAAPLSAQEKKPPAGLTPIPVIDLKLTAPVSFEKDILPIFTAKCNVCHAGKLTEGKLDLSTYASLMKGGKRGAALVAGKADDSFLFLVSSHNKKPIMPPKTEENPLTSKEVSLLKLWIDQGAKPPAIDNKITRTVTLNLPPAVVKPVRAVAVSPDKTTVAAGRANHVYLLDAKTGELKKTFTDPTLKVPSGKPANAAHISLVEAMAFSPDGKTLATGSFREVTLWDTASGAVKAHIGGFADRVVAIAYSPDGTRFATGGGAPTEDGEIKIFAADGKQVADIKNGHSDQVFGVCFSPDGKLLATAASDKFVKVFEVPSGKFVKSFEGHTQHVMDVGWTADGKKLASAGADELVKIWDYEKGEKLRDIKAQKNQVTRLMFVPKTATFLTCGGDGDTRLWNAENGGSLRNYQGAKDFLYAVACSPDGDVVVTGGEEGIVRIYEGKTGKLVKAVESPGETKPEPKKEPKKK